MDDEGVSKSALPHAESMLPIRLKIKHRPQWSIISSPPQQLGFVVYGVSMVSELCASQHVLYSLAQQLSTGCES